MPKVYDPELFKPFRAVLQSPGRRLDGLDPTLPQPKSHFLFERSTPIAKLVSDAVRVYKWVRGEIVGGIEPCHGFNHRPTIRDVVLLVNEGDATTLEQRRLMLSGIFGFDVTELPEGSEELQVFMSVDEDNAVFASIGRFGANEPATEETFFTNPSPIANSLALDASRIAVRTLVHNATYNDFV